ncbi:hypothetical protein GC173_18275 [bacterium]|nr:hypothetical protein [bacterium]
MNRTERPDILHGPWLAPAIYLLFCVAYALVVVPTWGWTYWDFGDGNYLYIARRVREGLVLYRDILAPQPPLHTFAGVVAQSLGETLCGSALIGARLYGLLVRLLAGYGLMLLAWRFYGCPFRALVAAAIWLALPIGFWWSIGYQSENLENVFLIFALYFLLPWSQRGALLAGLCSGLACQCNMTGLPFMMANALFLAFRKPRLLPAYLGAGFGVFAGIGIVANVMTDGYYLTNVILNQVGTFPRTDILQAMSPTGNDSFLQYAVRKVGGEAWKVLDLEGGLIIAAMIGALMALGNSAEQERDQWLRTEFLCWSFIGMLLSICFTAKGGTVNYIFSLGEPGVALFAAGAFVALWRWGVPAGRAAWSKLSIHDTRMFLRPLLTLLVIALPWLPAWYNIRATLHEVQSELPETEVLHLKLFIEEYAKPGDTILAPPFYAWLTGTNVAGEIAENYIWNIKYMNESFDAQVYGKPLGEGAAKMEEVAALLREQKAKVVLLDLAQTGTVPAIKEAIAEFYQLAEDQPYRTRNTSLGLYIPKGVAKSHLPLSPP